MATCDLRFGALGIETADKLGSSSQPVQRDHGVSMRKAATGLESPSEVVGCDEVRQSADVAERLRRLDDRGNFHRNWRITFIGNDPLHCKLLYPRRRNFHFKRKRTLLVSWF